MEGNRIPGNKIFQKGIYEYWVEQFSKEVAEEKKIKKNKKLSIINKKNPSLLIKKGRYELWEEKYGKQEAERRYKEWKKKISDYQQLKLKEGWCHSEETKRKIGLASKNRKISEETRIKMRKPKPLGFGDKISKLKKGISTGPSKNRLKVEQFSLEGVLLKVWESIGKAEKELKIYNISAVCKGKQETAGGYKWKYELKNNK